MTFLKCATPHYTYADYLKWTDSPGEELIDGAIYVREPSPVPLHQEIVVDLCRQVATTLKGKSSRVYIAPFDVRLPKLNEEDDQIDTIVQPDVLVVCDPRKIDKRGLRGAPDWIAEVLSPSTARYNQVTKLSVYERAGVREVWLIHPTDRIVTIYRLEAGSYGRPTILDLKGQTQIAAVPELTIDWDQMFADVQ